MTTAVFTFARMAPVTVGHEKLVNTIKGLASTMDAEPLVFLSHSHDNKRNPIAYPTKLGLAQTAFGDVVKRSDATDVFSVLRSLNGKYDNVIFVGDKARSDELLPIMQKYNNVEYSFQSIKAVSAGSRDSEEHVDSMRATKMRKYAIDNDTDSFTAGLPDKLKPYSSMVAHLVRKGMTNE